MINKKKANILAIIGLCVFTLFAFNNIWGLISLIININQISSFDKFSNFALFYEKNDFTSLGLKLHDLQSKIADDLILNNEYFKLSDLNLDEAQIAKIEEILSDARKELPVEISTLAIFSCICVLGALFSLSFILEINSKHMKECDEIKGRNIANTLFLKPFLNICCSDKYR